MAFPVRTILATTAVALMAAGCGSRDGIPRVPVSGSVTLDGQPLAQGQITFIPEDGENVASGAFNNGKYNIPRAEGPSPGPHRVSIWSKVPTGRQIVGDELNPQDGMVDEFEESIPERYNAQTELTAEVASGSNSFDFALTSEGGEAP